MFSSWFSIAEIHVCSPDSFERNKGFHDPKENRMTRRLIFLLLLSVGVAFSATFVEEHGRLQMKGTELQDKNGNPVMLRGTSMFWSQWSADYYNGKAVDWLVSDWKINLIRAAMGVDGTNSGYLVDSVGEMSRVDTIVAGAVRNGIYVIIDWHDHQANLHTAKAKAFFSTMAKKYKDVPNVIWEVWNEPLDTASWLDDIKPYAEAVIPEIRKYDTDNLIVVGTRSWSQRVDDVIGHTISDPNIAYTLHFYVGTHGEWLRGIGDKAIAAGIPLFVTEWGIWDAGYIDGDYTPAVDLNQLLPWMDWLESHKIASAMWSVNNKAEPSAALDGGASFTGNWKSADLSSAGVFIRDYLRGQNTGTWVRPTIPPEVIDTTTLPGRLEAEAYAVQVGIQKEKTSDIEGLRNIGYIENGDYAEYHVQVSKDATVPVSVRSASGGVGGTLRISIDGSKVLDVEIAVSGDWQVWTTQNASSNVNLKKGFHVIRFDFIGGVGDALFNLNYVDFGGTTSRIEGARLHGISRLRTTDFDLLGRFK